MQDDPHTRPGGFGRWAFVEVTDPWDAKNVIRQWLAKREPNVV
jgi:hypothetical protein